MTFPHDIVGWLCIISFAGGVLGIVFKYTIGDKMVSLQETIKDLNTNLKAQDGRLDQHEGKLINLDTRTSALEKWTDTHS
ncbi:hypothetical protein IRM63_03880 [Leuconostoc citreum]|uniref:hypothetical protein n=1 Tax=Leuconostoc citreum TaxID=33964 RepID=UPI001887022F|nr:hypothetical protein [Leuconostoc citreum]QOY98405.1 hypothetical protein IRM63_03880 [Leuconostoc citreum]